MLKQIHANLGLWSWWDIMGLQCLLGSLYIMCPAHITSSDVVLQSFGHSWPIETFPVPVDVPFDPNMTTMYSLKHVMTLSQNGWNYCSTVMENNSASIALDIASEMYALLNMSDSCMSLPSRYPG